MKTIQLTLILIFCPLVFFAQTLTGLWIGSVHNDSITIRKDESFEIVLTQYKDKVYGYSRSTFTVHDTLFYIVKRVKGSIDGDICEVKDDDIVSYNFKGRLDKGVKMVSTFRFDHNDSVWHMEGDWKTNKTKKYYALSGKIALSHEKDLTKSKIIPHLEELKLTDDIAVYNDYKKASAPIAPTPLANKPRKPDAIASTSRPPDNKPTKQQEQKSESANISKGGAQQPANSGVANNEKKNNPAQPISTSIAETKQSKPESVSAVSDDKTASATPKTTTTDVSVAKDKGRNDISDQSKSTVLAPSQPVSEPKKPAVKEESNVTTSIAGGKPVEQKKEPVSEQPKSETGKETMAVSTPAKTQPSTMFSDAKPAVASNAAVFVAERKISPPQIVNFVSDSLELALYDNGEVDGDTVSVLLNGEIILAKQGLKASAIKKMIYVPAGKDDSLTLVLYAENLGKYPPNTGLLIVHDGDETYQIRFSADLTQNAAVIFKRKRK